MTPASHGDAGATESARLDALRSYDILDTPPEPAFDDLAGLAAQLCGTETAYVTLVDADRQFFKAHVGAAALEPPLKSGFCPFVAAAGEFMEIPDTLADPAHAANPAVTGAARVRFYAGTPLKSPDGHVLGTLCVLGRVPHRLSPTQRDGLAALGRQVVTQLEARRRLADLARLAAERSRVESERARADEALRASEERYRTLFESIDDGFCLVEVLFDDHGAPSDYRFLEVNPTFARQTGLTEADGRTARQLVPNLEAFWFETYGRVATTGEPIRFVHGSEAMGRWFDVSTFRVGGDESRRVAILFRDVTERKVAEAALRRFKFMVERASDGMFLLDPLGRILYVNPAVCARLGYTEDELLAMGVPDIDPAFGPDRVRAVIARLLEHGLPLFETAHRRKDGTMVPVEISSAAVDIDDKQYIFAAARDVSERRAAEAERERLAAERDAQRRQLGTVLEQSPLAMVVAEAPSGRFLFANSKVAEITGRSRLSDAVETYTEDWRGRQLDGRPIAPEEWPLSRAVRHGEVVSDEIVQIEHPDGRRLEISLTAAPVRDAEGRIVAGVAMFRDVTDERRTEEQLRQAQRLQAVGTLAGGVAHEVNNQMTGVLGFGEFVLRALGPEHPQAEDMRQVLKAGERAARVTQQLLAFSRRQVTRQERQDLHQVVTELVPVLQRVLGSDKTLVLGPNRATAQVEIDRIQVEQVLINLAANARDAMGTDGRLSITLEDTELDAGYAASRPGIKVVEGPYVLLAVSDTGTGMDRDTLARAFEPFFTTKPVGEGTGLGLSVIYGIVKQHGGYVWAYSEPGHGTTFKVYLPAVHQRSGAAADVPTADAPVSPGRVLIVEDEPVVRHLARRVLESAGHTVLEASDGRAALEVVTADPVRPDLVVSDLVMPGMNGRELGEALRLRHPELRVLYMSGYTGDDVRVRDLLPPGSPFVQKPFTPDQLLTTVERLLRSVQDAPPDAAPR